MPRLLPIISIVVAVALVTVACGEEGGGSDSSSERIEEVGEAVSSSEPKTIDERVRACLNTESDGHHQGFKDQVRSELTLGRRTFKPRGETHWESAGDPDAVPICMVYSTEYVYGRVRYHEAQGTLDVNTCKVTVTYMGDNTETCGP